MKNATKVNFIIGKVMWCDIAHRHKISGVQKQLQKIPNTSDPKCIIRFVEWEQMVSLNAEDFDNFKNKLKKTLVFLKELMIFKIVSFCFPMRRCWKSLSPNAR